MNKSGFIIDHLGPFKAKSVLSKCRSMDEGMEEESEDDDDLRTLSFLTVKIGRVTCTRPLIGWKPLPKTTTGKYT